MRRLASIFVIGIAVAAFAQQPSPFSSTQFGGFNNNAQPAGRAAGSIDSSPMRHAQLTIIREQSVPAQEAGVIDALNFKEGDLVEQGSVLGVIDKKDAEMAAKVAMREYYAAKETAENQLRIEAGAMAYEVAKAEYDSSIEANNKKTNVVSQTELRRQMMEAERAKMQSKLAVKELVIANHDAWAKYNNWRRAEAALQRRTITSRLNGVVVKRNKHEGEWVQPGETVMRIIQMDQLRVEGDIDGSKYARHEVINRPVKITVYLTGGGEEVLTGKIVYASPLVELNEFTVRAEVNNRKINTADGQQTWLLTPGLKAKIELLNGNAIGALGAVGN